MHTNYRQLVPFLGPQRWVIAGGLLSTVGFVLTMPALMFAVGRIAESVAAGDVVAIARIAALALMGFIVRGALQYGQDSLMARATLQVVLNLRQRVYGHVQRLDLDYFAATRTGDLAYRLTEDLDRLGEVIQKFFHQVIPCLLTIIAVLSYMVYLNGTLTATTLIVTPFMGWLIAWFGQRMLQAARQSQDYVADLASMLTEVFGGISLIKAFAAEDYEARRFGDLAERNRAARFVTEHVRAIQYPVVGFLYALSITLVLWVGGWQISQGSLTGTEFLEFITGVSLLIDPIVQLTSNYGELKQGEASCDRVFELMHVQPRVYTLPGAQPLTHIRGEVCFLQVSFAYPDTEPVLNNINLTVKPGEVVALVGSSGAGKSTFVRLIPRFYDPQAGQILIDGHDIRYVTLDSLRRQIGIVPQEIVLFSGTIASNIAYGQDTYDLAAVIAAAKVANAHGFISQFPDGYQTLVGERGVNLSGGQRQRLAIARAVLLQPKILILDEATSALDNESEALVQEALGRLMQTCTVFVIAHRLSTIRDAHRILVLEKGRIVESGTHAELLAQGDRYARFYELTTAEAGVWR